MLHSFWVVERLHQPTPHRHCRARGFQPLPALNPAMLRFLAILILTAATATAQPLHQIAPAPALPGVELSQSQKHAPLPSTTAAGVAGVPGQATANFMAFLKAVGNTAFHIPTILFSDVQGGATITPPSFWFRLDFRSAPTAAKPTK